MNSDGSKQEEMPAEDGGAAACSSDEGQPDDGPGNGIGGKNCHERRGIVEVAFGATSMERRMRGNSHVRCEVGEKRFLRP